MRRRLLLSAVVAAVLAACARPGEDLAVLPSPSIADYKLGPGDQVRIITFGEEQLTGEFRVSDAGSIALPLIGGVKAAGLTPSELEKAVTNALKKNGLYRDPSVTVEVIGYRPIYILGEVNKPGEYPYKPGMTVVTGVAIAGGFTYRAMQDYADIVRTANGKPVEGRGLRQSYLQPGDVITIYERRF